MPPAYPSARPPRSRGFTMAEMLVVMAVIDACDRGTDPDDINNYGQ